MRSAYAVLVVLGGLLVACSSSTDNGNFGTGSSSGGSSGGGSSSGGSSGSGSSSGGSSGTGSTSGGSSGGGSSGSGSSSGSSSSGGSSGATNPDGGMTTSDGAASNDDASLPGWTLTWADEFNTADGTQPDPSKWNYDIGDGTAQGAPGWGNAELESYTSSPQNVVIQGGSLVITARKSTDSSLMCSGKVCGYTSGRIHTQGKFSQTYGRFEARIKIPFGSGVWPAFWMMGEQTTQANWPQYGEIDVMENAGSIPYEVRGSIHGPGGSANYTDNGLSGPYDLPMSSKVSDDYHVFAIEWAAGTISFFFDAMKYYTVTTADVTAVGGGATWPFDNNPNFILLDFAVDSGNFGDPPNAQTMWPQQMLIDYVRVYKKG
jgi:beta-glucanase (GH16 family)